MNNTRPLSLVIATALCLLASGNAVFADETNQGHIKWLEAQMEAASSFQKGSSIDDFLKSFTRDNGYEVAISKENWTRAQAMPKKGEPNSWPYAATFFLKNCPLIKVIVRFKSGKIDGEPNDLIEWISKPYLEKHYLQ